MSSFSHLHPGIRRPGPGCTPVGSGRALADVIRKAVLDLAIRAYVMLMSQELVFAGY
jgi:hypothetical protein